MPNPEPIKIEINGTLDLHQFNPKDTSELINEFISACHTERIYQGKIIHGKGIGTQRKIVHSKLKANNLVNDFWQGNETSGGWGTTFFSLLAVCDCHNGNQDA